MIEEKLCASEFRYTIKDQSTAVHRCALPEGHAGTHYVVLPDSGGMSWPRIDADGRYR